MSYFVNKNGQRTERHLAGPLRLAELLSDDEYARFQNGSLIALGPNETLLSLSSPIPEGQETILRPPRPSGDADPPR